MKARLRDFDSGLTLENLKELLHYCPLTGKFMWLKPPCGAVSVGERAGAIHPNGYRRIRINSHLYLAHRLAWFYMTGDWPLQIDHVNRVNDDNRFSNIRAVPTIGHNQANRRRFKSNTSGYTGVYLMPSGRWRARIEQDGKKRGLGTFDTREEADAVYRAAAIELFGEYARAA